MCVASYSLSIPVFAPWSQFILITAHLIFRRPLNFMSRETRSLTRSLWKDFIIHWLFFLKAKIPSSHFTLEIFQDCQCLQNYRVSLSPRLAGYLHFNWKFGGGSVVGKVLIGNYQLLMGHNMVLMMDSLQSRIPLIRGRLNQMGSVHVGTSTRIWGTSVLRAWPHVNRYHAVKIWTPLAWYPTEAMLKICMLENPTPTWWWSADHQLFKVEQLFFRPI